jgi:hypothetical protein
MSGFFISLSLATLPRLPTCSLGHLRLRWPPSTVPLGGPSAAWGVEAQLRCLLSLSPLDTHRLGGPGLSALALAAARATARIAYGGSMPKPPASRNLTDVASLARRHTEACINVLFEIVSNTEAPVRARTKAAKILRSLPMISLKRPAEMYRSRRTKPDED